MNLRDKTVTAPSEKLLSYHVFLKYKGKYYDPSYGAKYDGPTDFQTKAIAAYGDWVVNLGGKAWFGIRKPNPASIDVVFDN